MPALIRLIEAGAVSVDAQISTRVPLEEPVLFTTPCGRGRGCGHDRDMIIRVSKSALGSHSRIAGSEDSRRKPNECFGYRCGCCPRLCQ